jgi:hypothetical protein
MSVPWTLSPRPPSSPAPACLTTHSEILKVLNTQSQMALPAHRHQVGTCQALNLGTSFRTTHLDIHLGK